MARDGYRVAVVGATGAVGTAMRRLLQSRSFPAREVVPFASRRSAGRELEGQHIQGLSPENLSEFDLAIFSAGAGVSREWAPQFADAGAVVVDNSSAWRMDDFVPLVVAEVNPHALDDIPKGIVANPNCTTMTIMLPLKALHECFGLRSMVATSLQAAGGAGQKGMEELAAQVTPLYSQRERLVDEGDVAASRVTGGPVHHDVLAFNIVPLLGTEKEAGYTDEELKLVYESRKILELPELNVSPTCVRVPVMVGHAIQVRATFEDEVQLAAALAALERFPGVVVDELPTPLRYAGRHEIAVGRIRKDVFDPHSLNMFVVGDNLLKGAALNAVQLAELLHERSQLPLKRTRQAPRSPQK
jgi:aspartate-semialdehyde dehydrogenase